MDLPRGIKIEVENGVEMLISDPDWLDGVFCMTPEAEAMLKFWFEIEEDADDQ